MARGNVITLYNYLEDGCGEGLFSHVTVNRTRAYGLKLCMGVSDWMLGNTSQKA